MPQETASTPPIEAVRQTAPTAPLIRLEHVSRVYRRGRSETVALQDVSLTVRAGEFLVIMGPSGSGKSTLLQLMGALDLPTSGAVWFDGMDLARLSDAERSLLRRRRIGFVFQFFNLLATLTVLENVCLPAYLDGTASRPQEIEARATELLDQVGLAEKRHRHPAELSGGELQRAAIARALINRPALILADEPTGNLDSKAGQEVLTLLKRCQSEGGQTVVLVTHDSRAAACGDRVVRLKDGRIESITAPRDEQGATPEGRAGDGARGA